jgi:hypothetical protein
MKVVLVIAALSILHMPPFQRESSTPAESSGQSYLTWTATRAEQIGRSARVNGRVGGVFDFRGLHTERSYNYKLRATWLTPEVIRASARLIQLSKRLRDEQTEALVREAERVGDTVILVEIDPREGSGVIPDDWTAVLQPKGLRPGESGAVPGRSMADLRNVPALSGVFRRDYNYDVFWAVFPLITDARQPLFADAVTEAELVVQIHNKVGRVTWPVPASIRAYRRETG